QGGRVDDLRRVFGACLPQVLPATSRDLLGAGPDVAALRTRARRVAAEVAAMVI
ncbi:MAG: orotidine 5'-phosphate decarboxylase, partial [Actinomycetota bacterium]|nr:orotidine 5'-phosphate decarboxylase [Actinomycetota bacterium]